jgi:hypothetical protein
VAAEDAAEKGTIDSGDVEGRYEKNSHQLTPPSIVA